MSGMSVIGRNEKQYRVSSAFDDFDDIYSAERGFKPRECKIEVEETVREPDPYHPKIQSLLYESKDSSLQPPNPGAYDWKLKPEEYELQTNPIGLPEEKPPCYLPQENDDHIVVPSAQSQMGPIGPYATGRVDWSPLAGLTGTRPVVDSYSITRYSTNEWRQRNYETLQAASDAIDKSLLVEKSAKNSIRRAYEITDHNQSDNTKRLQIRSKDIDDWKQCLERAIRAMTDEICTLEEQRRRLKQAMNVLQMPESIVSECLATRTRRPESELVRDEPEEQLIKEKALIAEIRVLLIQTLADIEAQQRENRTNKTRLEFDWSDKKDAHEIESRNSQLNNRAPAIMFKPGATRFMAQQSTEILWEKYTVDNLEEAEKCRQKSIALRSTLDAILMNSARDLRTQADTVDRALHNRVICMDEMRQRLENELRTCLRRLADTEIQIEKLQVSIENMDFPMKVSQTRLDNRHRRLRVENCRDESQFALIGEVKSVHDSLTVLNDELRTCQEMKKDLTNQRGNLEREIMLKRRTINIDRERIQVLRTHFPSTTALTGY
ncbi:CLUMA_CG013164, isoform A [Clunio marinus]|uniref:Tektin n=1 Tax=Clunio marinus TaxID=568069 RepID=A0A1J1IHY3_9DIPT|nr:CLUMA_CG013164, isoform A [Clunio marinus]